MDIFSEPEPKDSSFQSNWLHLQYCRYVFYEYLEVHVSSPHSFQVLCQAMQEKDLKNLLDEWSDYSGFIQPTLGKKTTIKHPRQTKKKPTEKHPLADFSHLLTATW